MGYLLTFAAIYGLVFFPYEAHMDGTGLKTYAMEFLGWEALTLLPGILLLIYYFQRRVVERTERGIREHIKKCGSEYQKLPEKLKKDSEKARRYSKSAFYNTLKNFDSLYTLAMIADAGVLAYVYYSVRTDGWNIYILYGAIALFVLDLVLSIINRKPFCIMTFIIIATLMFAFETITSVFGSDDKEDREESLFEMINRYEMISDVYKDETIDEEQRSAALDQLINEEDTDAASRIIDEAHEDWERRHL